MNDALHYSEPVTPARMLTIADYAGQHHVTTRSVNRWLANEELPGAMKDGAGKWWIPADAVRNTSTAPAKQQASPSAAAALPQPPRADVKLPTLVTLEDMARVLGTTQGGVLRLAADGYLTIGPYGPRGARRVVIDPT